MSIPAATARVLDASLVQDALRLELRLSTEAAVAHGVFGVPSIELDGRQYWGLDGLPMLREALAAD